MRDVHSGGGVWGSVVLEEGCEGRAFWRRGVLEGGMVMKKGCGEGVAMKGAWRRCGEGCPL